MRVQTTLALQISPSRLTVMHLLIRSRELTKLSLSFDQSLYSAIRYYFRSAVIGLWLKIRKLTAAQVEDYRNKRRVITSLIWFFSSLGIAVIVPTIADAIAIVGALAAHFIFTFPGESSCDSLEFENV